MLVKKLHIEKSTYIDLEGFIPDVWISNMVRHLTLVPKVSVMDVLSQPVLSEGNPFSAHRSRETSHGCKESIVFIDVLVLVSIRVSVGCTEQFLFMNEMINVRLKARCEETSITGILLKISNTGEQRFVFIVHIRVLKLGIRSFS